MSKLPKPRETFRAASAIADGFEDGVGAAKRVTKQGADAAEALLHGAKKRLQRHPVETVIVTLATGIAVGIFIGWLAKRG